MNTKTTSASRPRLACRIARGWSALAGDPATGAAARHAATCPACQEYFAAAGDLESRLRRAAPQRAQTLPEGFDQRMQRALATARRDVERAPEREGGSRMLLWSVLGSVAAAAAVAFVLLRPTERPRTDDQFAVNPDEVIQESIKVGKQLNDFLKDSAPTVATYVRENPLQQEINAVYSDTRSALQFLALNFLPNSAQADNVPPAT